ncbi:permease [Sulfuriroseicoccus oceanibius]|uniref:Permease n=1 Tax=Sulfuriroseicoccus oceanibius TaxID=2707525 RepID=A0A6B3LCJ6_9BACT|nr:permease [Sulfuriroseicoccus oceanibius]QQL44758.1 permease [Sulfuriroseicoccus oceanibius]
MTDALKGDLALTYLSIMFEGVPFILLGTIISGFIDIYLPGRTIERLLPKNPFLAVLFSGVLGLLVPVCECTTVPVMRRLIQKGLPVSCAVVYMLAAPAINPVSLFNTYKAFIRPDPWFMVSSRFILTFGVSVMVGWALLALRPQHFLRPRLVADVFTSSAKGWFGGAGSNDEQNQISGPTVGPRDGGKLISAMRASIRDFLETFLFFSIGVLLTAVMKESPLSQGLEKLASEPGLATPVLLVFAFVSSLCSTTDALIIAQYNFAYGPKLGFLVFGPMMDIKLVFLYLTIFRGWFVAALGVVLFLVIWALTWNWHGWTWDFYMSLKQ